MDRNIQKQGLINLFILLTAGVAGFAVSDYAHALAGQVAIVFIGLGFLVAAVSWFQMRLEERERLEKLEFDEITKGGAGTTIFDRTEVETFPARRSREQFEKFFLPGFTVLLFLLQAGGAWWVWRRLPKPPVLPLHQPVVAMGLLGLLALVLFLIGKYSAGIARLENQRLLRPGASYLLLGAYLFALAVGAIVAIEAGFTEVVDLYLARGLCALLAVLALETIFSLILEIYRPRVKGKVGLVLYESRLVGLLSHPEGLFTTAAHALDYQFGFKVSETWFYRFLQKALLGLVLAQIGILLFSTSFVFIEAGEEGLLERFGRPIPGREVIGPGFHFKLPWPIDKVHRFRTQEIQTFHVGLAHDEKQEQEKTVLWTISHFKEEFHLLVASREQSETTNNVAGKKSPPVNLLSVSIPVQYQINDLRAWAYNYKDASNLLERIATREVVRYLVNVDLNEVMSTRRFEAAEELRRRIQARVDEPPKLGVKIIFLNLSDLHPPVQVAAAYEEVMGARQKREADILNAEAHGVQTNALSSAAAVTKVRQAEAAGHRLKVTADARTALFTNQFQAYRASPGVYQQRAYLQTLVGAGSGARKVILATTNTQDVILLNLEDKIAPDLLDALQSPSKSK